MKKNALISVLAVAASFPTVAKGFVLHLEHGFDAHNPVVILGGTQPFPTNAEEFGHIRFTVLLVSSHIVINRSLRHTLVK